MKPAKTLLQIAAICGGIGLSFLLPGTGVSQPCEQEAAGKVVSAQGVVQARKAGGTQWVQVKLDETYCPGDMIRVQENSRAKIALSNGAHNLRLGQNTTITFLSLGKEQTSIIDLFNGIIHIFSRFPRKLKVETPFVTAAVEGTEFYVKVERDQTFLSILEGRVAATNKTGSLVLASGQSAVARAGQAPALRVLVQPRDAVQWALYYPPIINWRRTDFPGGSETDWQGMVRRSIGFYWKGDLTRAFSALEKAPKDIRDARFYLYRAALFLTVGRVVQARKDISKALIIDPSNSSAFALQSIMDVVQNKKDKALSLANKAVELDTKSSTAGVALSYAQQANFDIQGALNSLEEAVKLDPENALAWARLAELFLSVADLDKATDAANEAVVLNPNLARTQTVLGYAYLTQIKIKDAKNAFKKAIELDSAAPLARLGLGLAIIRQGDLEAGRAEIEIASGLDPNNSLIRSYLGKAYYDERQDKLARDQFAVAKELDPLDPTPWFYDAIRKQTTNRPVEALQDMQKSIELNDNRAVYRSRLLLDEDLAARSASLGRIYNDLGYQQLGLVEGWKSVNTSPANYSAHRLLADLYAALPRHEIARVSELLQSQLLQPINITPVQPQLAESSLLILDGAGPSDLSFNEFNPLFLRNRFALQANGVLGGNDTYGDDLVQSTVWDRFSYSLGQFHYETDGFRENNDLNQDIYNVFAQVSLSPNTSVQGEFRYSDIKKGDLDLTFTGTFIPTQRQKELVRTSRFGFHHAFTPRSDIIASFIYQNGALDTDVFPGFFELKSDLDNYVGEIRYLYNTKWFEINGGLGHRYRDQTLEQNIAGIPSEADIDTQFTNAYLYSNIHILKNINLTVGASADFLDSEIENEDRDQFNPKLGFTWHPLPTTTLRAAVFRTLQRPFLSKQNPTPTLEPTQVAGFNQFFLDNLGTEAWRYGIGVNQEFSHDIYAGAEISYRDLNATLVDESGPSPVVRRRDWDERQLRAYLYWPPFSWLALRAEYLYERFKRDVSGGFAGAAGFSKLRTHRVQLGAGFFLPSGFIFDLKANYIDQDGDFAVFSGSGFSIVPGNDQFWIFDASIGYRLPKRYGIVTLEAKNLFDESFQFQDTDPANPRILPDRLVLMKLSLSF